MICVSGWGRTLTGRRRRVTTTCGRLRRRNDRGRTRTPSARRGRSTGVCGSKYLTLCQRTACAHAPELSCDNSRSAYLLLLKCVVRCKQLKLFETIYNVRTIMRLFAHAPKQLWLNLDQLIYPLLWCVLVNTHRQIDVLTHCDANIFGNSCCDWLVQPGT